MKQDVNYLLLGLIIAVLAGMVSIALYAQHEYQNLNLKYSSAVKELDNKSTQLEKKAEEINKTRSELEDRERALVDIVHELNLSAERATALGGFFENLKGQKELLEGSLNATAQEKEKVQSQYNTAKKDLQVCTETNKLQEDHLKKERAKTAQLSVTLKDISLSINRSLDQLASVDKAAGTADDEIIALRKKVGGMDVPSEISEVSKTELEDDLDSMQSFAENKLQTAIDTLRATLSAVQKKAGGST